MQHTRSGFPPAIVCVACNGGIQGRESHPALPETAEQIADSVYYAYQAGASMVHAHARNPKDLTQGARVADHWKSLDAMIRERCPDIIINYTTGGDLEMTMTERISSLSAKPEIASLNLTPDMSRFRLKQRDAPLPNPRDEREIDCCIPFTYGIIEQFAAEMKKRGIKPELEIYHPGGAWVIRNLIEKKLIAPPYLIQTVMGAQTASYPTPENLLQIVKEFPPGAIWLCSGIGPFQLPMITMGAIMGGHIRVGLEDNLYLRRGQQFKDNADAVRWAVRICTELNREVATPNQARAILGLPSSVC
ncbi:MAG TPA: 3-keto-5-aminohexanoate cleavage protein [Woeseiaceae bacterium]|nr:3-keto-5-aminohexanoate cleavage protein [Woeseiaceae bacterium]